MYGATGISVSLGGYISFTESRGWQCLHTTLVQDGAADATKFLGILTATQFRIEVVVRNHCASLAVSTW